MGWDCVLIDPAGIMQGLFIGLNRIAWWVVLRWGLGEVWYNWGMKKSGMELRGMGRFCQSKEWQRYEEMEGRETFWREGEGWHYLAVLYKRKIGNYLYCPYGPVAGARELPVALDSLATLAREQGCFFVRIEPMLGLVDEDAGGSEGVSEDGAFSENGVISVDELKKLGCVKSHDLDPAHTWVLELEGKTRDELLAGMSGTRVRYWKKAERSGVKVRRTKDPEEIEILTRLLGDLGEKNGFRPQSYEHLKHQMEAGFATLYVAEVEESDGVEDGVVRWVPIAALLVHEHDGVRSYAHAATDDKYRKLSGGAVVTVQAILDAKDEGMREFDFGGFDIGRSETSVVSFYAVQEEFWGVQLDYAGTWDRPVVKWKYWVYRLLRRVKNRR